VSTFLAFKKFYNDSNENFKCRKSNLAEKTNEVTWGPAAILAFILATSACSAALVVGPLMLFVVVPPRVVVLENLLLRASI
jgi:hypothetical protein